MESGGGDAASQHWNMWRVVVVMQPVSTGICWPVALFEKLKAAS